MPQLPRNMIRRKDRAGYWFRTEVGGKARQMSLGTDYQEACRKLRQLQRQIEQGSVEIPFHRLTVSDVTNRWLDGYVATARGETFQVLSRCRAGKYLIKRLGCHLVTKLTGEHVRGYRLWLEGQGLKPMTVRHVLADLRCMLRWCEECGVITRSPFPRKVMPRIQEKPPDRLTAEEAARVVTITDPYGFVVRLAVGTGLRWGELVRLRSEDVQGDVLVIHQTKSGKVRRVPLSPALKGELRNRIGKLVPYEQSSRGSFNAMVKKLSGVERFHVHQLRHTFACLWLERGGSLAALQQILGHSTVVVTQRYARLTDEAVQLEARKVMGVQA